MTCILFRPPHLSSCHRLWTCLGKQANVQGIVVPAWSGSTMRDFLQVSCLCACPSRDFAVPGLRGPARRKKIPWPSTIQVDEVATGPPSCSRASVASSYCGMGIHFGLADVTASCGLGLASHAIVDVRKPRTCRRVKGRIPHLQRIKGTGANVGDGPRAPIRSNLDITSAASEAA